jgi:hypothetical protein
MGDRLGKQHGCNMYELMPCIMQAIPDSFLQLSTLLTAEAIAIELPAGADDISSDPDGSGADFSAT